MRKKERKSEKGLIEKIKIEGRRTDRPSLYIHSYQYNEYDKLYIIKIFDFLLDRKSKRSSSWTRDKIEGIANIG